VTKEKDKPIILRIADWRQGRRSGLFEALQLLLIGVYVTTVVAPHVRITEATILSTQGSFLRTFCNLFFVIDATAVFVFSMSQRPPKNKTLRAQKTIFALGAFLTDLLLVVLSFLRPLRVLRPIMVARRLSASTQHSRRKNNKKVDTDVEHFVRATGLIWQRIKFSFLILYSLALIICSTATLILESELRGTGNIRNYANSVWYCIGEMTLTGTQYNADTLAGRSYTVLLLVMGFGVTGLFTTNFPRGLRAGLTPKKLDEIKPED
jgi:hypothetical protein